MYAVGMLGSYLTQGVYAVAGPFQPFGGAVDIIVVQQEDDTFKSSPWYVKFGDFQGVLKRQEKIVDISVNDVPADFHMILDSKGEAYFEKEVESDERTCFVIPDGSSSIEGIVEEGEVESVVDACSQAQEALSSTTSSGLPEMNCMVSIAEVKKEEIRETQDEGSGACDNSHLETKDASNMNSQWRLQTVETHNGVCGLEAAPHTEIDINCLDVASTQEERWEIAQEQSVVCTGDRSYPGPGNVSAASSMNSQTGSELSEAYNRGSSIGAALTENDIICVTRADNSSAFEDSPELEGVPFTSQDSSKTDRGSDVVTIVKEESVFHSTTIFAMEGSSLQAVTLSDIEVMENLSSVSNSGVKDDQRLVDMWAGGTFEGSEADHNCNHSSMVDTSLDEDEVFTSFECVTVEGEREELIYSRSDGMHCDVSGDFGTNRDSLSWDFESPVNQALSDEVFSLSQSSSLLPEEDSGNADVETVLPEKEEIFDSNASNDTGSLATLAAPFKWRLWPFLLRWYRIEKASSMSNQDLLAAANVAIRSSSTEGLLQKNGYYKWQQKTKVRTYVPTSVQLASLNLKDGPNKVTFTFSSVLGKTQVDARIYLWKWNTRIVISDVDGTITKSDVLGQVMPLVGRDWSQYGVTRLFSAIKDNGYEVLFLSARAISQAYLTRRFLLNLKQDGEALPEGPVFISPDGLIPSLYREVIRRAPHEFKISCLEGIRELFPEDVNPFYAGFGNRETDVISYLKVGIPKGKIFIINPKGEVVVDHRVDCKSYTSLHGLVDEMFPPMSSHEQEEFNEWNFWKMPLPDIEDELNCKSSKSVKRVGSSKK